MIIKNLTVGEHAVVVEIDEPVYPDRGVPFVQFRASCNEHVREGRMTYVLRHDHSEEQLRKDIDEFAQSLAAEAAGYNQGSALRGAIWK